MVLVLPAPRKPVKQVTGIGVVRGDVVAVAVRVSSTVGKATAAAAGEVGVGVIVIMYIER